MEPGDQGVQREPVRVLPARGRLAVNLAAAAILAVAALGCGGAVVAEERLEDEVKEELERALNISISEVDCPSDIPAEASERFRCEVNAIGASALESRLRISSDEVDVQIIGVKGR